MGKSKTLLLDPLKPWIVRGKNKNKNQSGFSRDILNIEITADLNMDINIERDEMSEGRIFDAPLSIGLIWV